MKRREFIILGGIGATSASLLSACGHPENRLIPALIPDDEFVPGIDYWKASTCGMCAAGCGIIVRTREHKANKIEGNPLHPVNRGALCARGQAGLEVLYNPDRIKGPMKRAGERGEGKWEDISWDEAIKTLADKLREIKSTVGSERIWFATSAAQGVNALAVHLFSAANGPISKVSSPRYNEVETVAGYSKSYHLRGVPTFDISNSTYLLSFEARFLETWLSPVMYSVAYGEFRRSSGRMRGKFVQIEPRMSLTGANADEWLPAAPGTHGLIALAMAQVIIREGLVKQSPPPQLISALEEYAPEKTSELIDVQAEKLIRIAREFAKSERPLAIASDADSENLALIHVNFLNALVGNWNRPGGMYLPGSGEFDPLRNLIPAEAFFGPLYLLENDLRDGKVSALLVHRLNPVYTAPRILEKFREIPFIASFSSVMDETTSLADLILPDNSFLESWDIRAASAINTGPAAVLSRPVLNSGGNSRQLADTFINLAREIGSPLAFESAEQMVKAGASELRKKPGSIEAEDEQGFWDSFLERGFWTAPPAEAPQVQTAIAKLTQEVLDSLTYVKSGYEKKQAASADSEYPYTVLSYEHSALGFGEQANLPALQELPDPMTSVVWGSWLEINPRTARELGIVEGDLVEVSSEHGSVRVPAIIYKAIRPDVVAMPCCQGHSSPGRFASGRGTNAHSLRQVVGDGQAFSIRAKIVKSGNRVEIVRFGTDLGREMETKR
jgi:anaerobic selenocysteine-containing dehydrogenase